MTKRILGVALLLASAHLALADEPTAVDITAAKPHMKVLTDGKGHFLAMVPFTLKDEVTGFEADRMVFYSADGKTFYQQRAGGSGRDGDNWSMAFWEPRVGLDYFKASFGYTDNAYWVTCFDRTTTLTEGDASVLDSGVFLDKRWVRRPYFLARDDRGTYYYIDQGIRSRGNKGFRLFAGQKGAMKLTKLKNVVSDSKGVIFATKKGDLRLVANAKRSDTFDDAVWVKGKKKTQLTFIPVDENTQLIFDELGVYTGQPLGTPCDDL